MNTLKVVRYFGTAYPVKDDAVDWQTPTQIGGDFGIVDQDANERGAVTILHGIDGKEWAVPA